MSVRLVIAPTAIAGLIVTLLSGCQSSQSTVANNATPTQATTTCAEYKTFGEEDKRLVVGPPPNFTTYVYTKTSASVLTEAQFFDAACAKAKSTTTLNQLKAPGTPSPTCAPYLDQQIVNRSDWARVVAAQSGAPSDVDAQAYAVALTNGCKANPSANLLGLAAQINVNPPLTSISTAASPSVGATSSAPVIWSSESKLGYSMSGALSLEPAISTAAHHPDNTDFTAGAACGFTAGTDLAVPVSATVTNTTLDRTYQVSTSLTIEPTTIPAETTTALLEGYGGGKAVCGAAINASGVTSLTVESKSEIPSYSVLKMQFFVILKNYYSPRYPSGDSGDLGAYRLVIRGAGTEADPMQSGTLGAIDLTGSAPSCTGAQFAGIC